ncbi:MAG: hypothetical protein OXD42_08195, partial [Rhodospirillaceae bacterium]|nr:hypothetical protein [Rhodospirillaceae bacterium]
QRVPFSNDVTACLGRRGRGTTGAFGTRGRGRARRWGARSRGGGGWFGDRGALRGAAREDLRRLAVTGARETHLRRVALPVGTADQACRWPGLRDGGGGCGQSRKQRGCEQYLTDARESGV